MSLKQEGQQGVGKHTSGTLLPGSSLLPAGAPHLFSKTLVPLSRTVGLTIVLRAQKEEQQFSRFTTVMDTKRATVYDLNGNCWVPSGRDRLPLRKRSSQFFWTWYALFTHFLLCSGLSALMVFKLDGYAALGDDKQPRRQANGQFILRVSDITTFISILLVLIRFMATSWIGILLWNYSFALLQNDGLQLKSFSRIMSWKILPPTGIKTKGLALLVWLTLLCILPQNLISPLLTGSVNWNIGSEVGEPILVASGAPFALESEWFWYLKQEFTRRQYVHRAAGLAGLAWSNLNTAEVNGTYGVLGRTCRRVVEFHNDLPENSTLFNATVPCIEINGITWPNRPLSNDSRVYKRITHNFASKFSLIGEQPFSYFQSGVGILFDPDDFEWNSPKLYNSSNSTAPYFPPASVFSGTMTAIMFIERHPETGCNPIRSNTTGGPSVFGEETERLTRNVFGFFDTEQFCFAHAMINITAGVIVAPQSRYVSSRVVEASDDNSPSQQEIQPSTWVREAMFLMPDTMTKISLMNTSSISTWNSLDGYTTSLVRQAYLANWDMLHATFEQSDTAMMSATPPLLRQLASVSLKRVLAWEVLSFLLTVSGFLVLIVQSRYCGHGVIVDGPTAALLLDAKDVVSEYRETAELRALTNEEEAIKVYLNCVKSDKDVLRFKLGIFNGEKNFR
jgi:hypothetical protein